MSDDCRFTEYEAFCKATECGLGDKMFCSALIGDIQEAGERGSDALGYGTPFLRDHGICWIILRMRLHFDTLPSWGDTFYIRTWANSLKKIYYGREFEIVDSSGNVIGMATSTWILADWNSHRPVIAGKNPDLPEYVLQGDEYVFGDECPKIKVPDREAVFDETVKPAIIKYADFNELDRNRHVNNTRYTAWAYDALYKSGYDVSLIEDLIINYNSEVKPGDKVEVFITDIDGVTMVYGYKNFDTKVFAVRVTMRKV